MLLVALAALVLAPAAGAGTPSLTPADRQQIGVLIDRFVKEAVRGENLPAAWSLIGPGLRGGTTYPAKGTDFTHAWTGTVVGPGDVIVALMFHPDAAHPKIPQTAFKAEIVRRGGRWVVDGFYPAATFFGGGHVEGPADFQASAGARSVGATNAKVSSHSFAIAMAALAGVIVLVPLGFWLNARRRSRRAYAAYLQASR
jgi:hypothetical protein